MKSLNLVFGIVAVLIFVACESPADFNSGTDKAEISNVESFNIVYLGQDSNEDDYSVAFEVIEDKAKEAYYYINGSYPPFKANINEFGNKVIINHSFTKPGSYNLKVEIYGYKGSVETYSWTVEVEE